MAKYAPSNVGVGEIRGSAGGTTYSRNRFGTYIRNRVTPVNPVTPIQTERRTDFSAATEAWRNLTDAQRLGWINAAPSFPRTDELGQTYIMTGHQMFVGRFANARLMNFPDPTAYSGTATPTVITTFSATAAAGASTLDITFAPAIAAGNRYLLYATRQVSDGVNFMPRSEYRFLRSLALADVSPFSAGALYEAKFGDLLEGEKIFLRLIPARSTLNVGTFLEISVIVAA